MIRILHLTDFHFNNKTLRDWDEFYKDAFFSKLNELTIDKKIDFVFFTGDLIDKGGKDFKETKIALNEFNKNIIQPILEKLNLNVSRFIICPGNHDINRFADTKIDENGLKNTLNNTEEVINFINEREKEKSFKYIKRIEDYKNFELELYKDIDIEKNHSIFNFSLKYNINGLSVGVSSLNSSWRCYDDDDYGNILIGENQINNNFKFIKDCQVKIALIHHQLDWVSKIEKGIITSHLNKNYDIILSGHVHEHMSIMATGFTGSSFHNVSPSGLNQIRTDNLTFVNGFTIIDYNENIDCHYLKYNHSHKEFVDNTDIVPTGKKRFVKPKLETENDLAVYNTAINNIKEDHYEEMNSHFIKSKNDIGDQNVKTSFIYPPIDDGKKYYDENQSNTNFNEILNSNNHMLFLGQQEIGKTSLLYRLIVEYVDEFDIYKKIPVYIDFNNIKNKEFITIIKEYTRLNTEYVKNILTKGNFIIFLDNINYHESRNLGTQINKLHNFYKDYPKVRIIGSYQHDNLEIIPTEVFNHCKIPFSYQFIRALKTKEIKLIMKQWLPSDDVIKTEEKLEKLVNTFSSYNLPNNALSVHLYLWSMENGDKKPINQAVLMEIYVELILEKLNKDNVYRNNFDFTNKIQLISMIAEKIIKKENNEYWLDHIDFYDIIHDYLKNKVGFSFDTNIILEYLLDRKIFTKNNQNEIRFSHVCFMHFFVAKRMKDNQDFKKYILSEDRYFNYPKELDYYTGLVRSDKETFELIYKRFQKLFDPMSFILEAVSPDEYFNIHLKKDSKNDEPLARNLEIAKIKDSRPSEEAIEKQYDEQLEKITNLKQEIKGNKNIDFDRMLLIMCNVLRNSEGIEDLELKSKAYNDIVKHNITYSILYTQVVVRYLIEFRKLPPSVPQNISLEYILKNIPYNMQYSLFTHLGTQKLSAVISNKMALDLKGKSNTKSEIEKFLSVALYSDIQGPNFDNYLRSFVKSINSVPVQNYMLFKLTEYLYKRSKEGSDNEIMYLDLIADLKIRTQKLPKRLKEQIKKDLLEKKSKFSKILRIE